jgi:branched-chain amino acid transport system permease protein
MTLLGGLGTRWGPVVGAVVIVALESKLAALGVWPAEVTHVAWF